MKKVLAIVMATMMRGSLVALNVLVAQTQEKERRNRPAELSVGELAAAVEALEDPKERRAMRAAIRAAELVTGGSERAAAAVVMAAHARARGTMKIEAPLITWTCAGTATPATC